LSASKSTGLAKNSQAPRSLARRRRVTPAAGLQVARVARAQIALSRLLSKPVIHGADVGATKLRQLDVSIAAVDVKLSQRERSLGRTVYPRRGGWLDFE
jgi:aryl-alcohol dehydrogenase-like predicted oxidoreductase